MENTNERNEMISWSVFLGCMFLGMGIGMLFDQAGVGMFIGFGLGYIAEPIIEGVRGNQLPK